MSELNSKRNNKHVFFDRMSTEELEELLRQNSELPQGEEYDMGAILYIAELIASREKENPSGRFTDVHTAWSSFKKDYYQIPFDGTTILGDEIDIELITENKSTANVQLIQSSRRRPVHTFIRVAGIAAIFAVILITGTVTAYAMGFDLWGHVAQWSADIFGFEYAASSQERNPLPFKSAQDTHEFTDLQFALDEYGITEKLIPNYLPEGFEQTEFYVYGENENLQFVACFVKDGRTIVIQLVKHINQASARYQKDEGDPEIYEAGGVEHYIMTNVGNFKAVWVNDCYECSISGLTDRDELIKIIDSIYKE